MTHSEILNKVCRSIDRLIATADQYEGLFPSVLDLNHCRMPDALPPNIPGQRNEDRAHPGSNLMHDKYTLNTMYGLSKAADREDYAQAADRYLKRFATHCTDTTTGLFPWGEHSFWNVLEDRVGNSFPLAYDWWTAPAIHDHLSAAPFWMWEKLYEYNPVCVERFAEGLDFHWRDGEPQEYCRHANIEIKERPPREERSCDFPRHGGFYIMDWSFAYVKTGRDDFLRQINRMLDHWWTKRDPSGMLPLESKTPEHITVIYNKTSPGQATSLAMSLLETAELLEGKDPELASRMRERGTVYANSFLTLPHDPEKGVFVSCTERDTGEIFSTFTSWGSSYGSGVAAGMACSCVGFYRRTGNEGFLRWAMAVGQGYVKDPVPQDVIMPAGDAGAAVALLADLYEITGERSWLDEGLRLAQDVIAVYLDHDLPRGASGIGYCDSQMGTGVLLYGLARIALLSADQDGCPLKADYSCR